LNIEIALRKKKRVGDSKRGLFAGDLNSTETHFRSRGMEMM
jgi:hypothetical protein